MKFKEYIENLTQFAKENPESLELEVIYSKDDEGNGYYPVIYLPTTGIYEDCEFISCEQLEDYDRENDEINSICIN